MRPISSRRIRTVAAATMAVAALTSAGVNAVGVGNANADTTNWAPTYTCDTLTNWGVNPYGSPMLEIEGDGNCAASNGAPLTVPTDPIDPNPVSLVSRADGTVYHCTTTNYEGQTWVDLPIKVLGMLCVLAS